MIDQYFGTRAVPGSVALVLLAWLLQYIINRPKKLSVPVVKFDDNNLMTTIVNGKNTYPDQPFALDLTDHHVILPISHVDEVKNMPESKLSFSAYLAKHNLSRWTMMRVPPNEVVSAVRNDLTRNIGKVIGDLQDEVKYIFGHQLKECPTWKPIPVVKTVLPIVAGLSARTFVGLPLCRDPEWLESTITYTGSTVAALMSLKKWHPMLRPIFAPFLPAIRKLNSYSNFGARKLKPQLDAIVETYQKKTSRQKTTEAEAIKGDFNMVHWIVGNSPDLSKVNPVDLGNWQMSVAFAAIHTTSMALSQVLFDLAAYPDYAQEIREELEAVLEEENLPNRELLKTSIPKLKKMDSFIKETQRMNPPSPIQFNRQVVAKNGLELSDGTVLPNGTAIAFCAPYLPNSKTPDNNLINNPSQPPLDTFAPWRFSDIRKLPGEESKHQFVSATPDNPVFGVGPHACPGRFFASNEMKIIISELLRNYDLALGPNGEADGVGDYKRPPSLQTQISISPDPRAVIHIRSRSKA